MSLYRISQIRSPDEFRHALGSVVQNFDRHAEWSPEMRTIELKGLAPEQSLAHSIFFFMSEADEVIGNLNMAIADMEQLGKNAAFFNDRDPFKRFQFLVRMYFYEYGRFEDAFAYLTKWMELRSLMTKYERSKRRQAFYDYFEHAIKTRNVMLHDGVSWEDECSPEIAFLQGLAHIGQVAVNSAGKQLSWDDHIGPLCDRTLPTLLAMGQHMQVFWSMEFAHVALTLVEKGCFPSPRSLTSVGMQRNS